MRTILKDWYWRSGGAAETLTAPTESELLAYIMANFPPDFFLDPEQGLVDSSGNGVAVTTNGSPTVHADGGLNNRGYIALDGVDDAVVVDRVDNVTHAFVFRHNNTGQMLLNVPTANTGSGDGPKFFKQGFQWNNSSGFYRFIPDSLQQANTSTETVPSTSWKSFLCRGENYLRLNGKSVYQSLSAASANTTVSKMFYGCWGRGDGANLANFTQYDLGLSMIWNSLLTQDQLNIVHAYLEVRFDNYAARTYLYNPASLELDINNPIFTGNVNSGSPYNQSYPPRVLPEGVALYKGLPKDIFAHTTSDFITWNEQPKVVADAQQAWENNGHNIPEIIKDGATYYLFLAGRDSSNNYSIGLATTTTSPPITLANYTKYASNPIITYTEINSALGTTYNTVFPGKVWKKDGDYFMIVYAHNDSSIYNIPEVILATGTSWTNWTTFELKISKTDYPLKVFSAASNGVLREFTNEFFYCRGSFAPCLVKQGGKLVGLISVGCQADDLTFNHAHDVYPIICDDDGNYDFKIVCNSQSIVSGGNEWDRNMAYLPSVMVEQDGEFLTPSLLNNKWLVSYAGLGTTAEAVNTKGQSGFAYAPKKLVENLLP